MDRDDEDFIFFGTPIEREEEITSRKRKAAADAAGQLRSLPPWKQEVRDEEGRQRFHGAFTGGFSAGFYNTVGSKEGWTPQTFTSSRKSRAETKQQSVYNFLDEDEKAEMEGHLGTSLQFDTFGFTAAELARKQAAKEQLKRPSAIPGPAPDEIVLPVAESIGAKLLQKMGWRHGHSIKDARTNSLYDARREARKAFLAFSCDEERPLHAELEDVKSHSGNVTEWSNDDDVSFSRSTPVYVLNPKQDLYGLGFDPFKHAPEFRERKRLRAAGNKELGSGKSASKLFVSNSGKAAPGFGIGALEEYDAEDEDIYASGFEFEETYVEEDEEPSRVSKENKLLLDKKEHGVLSGFKVASSTKHQMERFDPPVIPPDFEPHHKFSAPLNIERKFDEPPPLDVSPPEDSSLRLLVEGFASLVARCGKLFEDLSREKNKYNPLFSFLSGGNGHDFYARKLWEAQQKHVGQKKQQVDMKSTMSMQKMTAESRGRILGERPLERTSKDSSSSVSSTDVVHLQYNLKDTFMKPVSLGSDKVESLEAAKPFKHDPAKQERFEQFLKDKYQGGLRSIYPGANSCISEDDRARERLDFEAAAEVIEKGKRNMAINVPANQQLVDILPTGKGQFVSGGVEQDKIPQNEEIPLKQYPHREEYQWRPSPILCKRFDIIDPFLGKPPPMPRARRKMDSLILMPEFLNTTRTEEIAAVNEPLPVSQPEIQDAGEQISSMETENVSTTVERPVDLYKAIFSDDSDDEEDNHSVNQVDDAEKKNEVVHTTLNRLIAGDFLESLGKELGLEVPPDAHYPTDKINNSDPRRETINMEGRKISSGNAGSSSAIKTSSGTSEVKGVTAPKHVYPEATHELSSSGRNCEEEFDKVVASSDRNQLHHDSTQNEAANLVSRSKAIDVDFSGNKSGKTKNSPEDRRHRKHSRRYPSSSTSGTDSFDDRRDKKHRASSRRQRSVSVSDTDSSDVRRYRDHSSQRKSRNHSKHHSHKRKESPSRASRHGSLRGYDEVKLEKRKSKSKSDRHKKHH